MQMHLLDGVAAQRRRRSWSRCMCRVRSCSRSWSWRSGRSRIGHMGSSLIRTVSILDAPVAKISAPVESEIAANGMLLQSSSSPTRWGSAVCVWTPFLQQQKKSFALHQKGARSARGGKERILLQHRAQAPSAQARWVHQCPHFDSFPPSFALFVGQLVYNPRAFTATAAPVLAIKYQIVLFSAHAPEVVLNISAGRQSVVEFAQIPPFPHTCCHFRIFP